MAEKIPPVPGTAKRTLAVFAATGVQLNGGVVLLPFKPKVTAVFPKKVGAGNASKFAGLTAVIGSFR